MAESRHMCPECGNANMNWERTPPDPACGIPREWRGLVCPECGHAIQEELSKPTPASYFAAKAVGERVLGRSK